MSKKAKEEIETAIGGKGRVKILGALGDNPPEWQTVYSISKKTGLNRALVKDNLKDLIQVHWVEKSGSYVEKYRLYLSNPKADDFLKFLKESEYFDDSI